VAAVGLAIFVRGAVLPGVAVPGVGGGFPAGGPPAEVATDSAARWNALPDGAVQSAPAGAARQADAKTEAAPGAVPGLPPSGVAQAPAPSAGAAASGAALSAMPPLPFSERMIVKSGSLTAQVTDLSEGMRRVGEVVAGIPGAYVASSSTSYRGAPAVPIAPGGIVPPAPAPRATPGASQTASVTLKVPAGDFGTAMERLRTLGTPLQEQISTQEVTEEYVDLEAQVRSLEAVEQQYLRLLERAQRIEEIIPLQQRVTEVRTQIDRLRGRMNLLQRRSDLSTITVGLVLSSSATDPGLATEPRPLRTLRLAFAGLGGALQGLLDVAIFLGVYLLPLLPVVVAVYWWRRNRVPAGRVSTAAASVEG
jgi:hypothetical protein